MGVEADNVGSKQMQQIRIALRGHAVVLMGKNTMMRKAIRGHLQNNPQLELLLPHIKGNIGFVFTKIAKGTIEIIQNVDLIKTGDKVGMSESTLLNMLGISPFTYGLIDKKVYEAGSIFDPTILDITD